jgi:hypothetical protein
LYSCGMAFQKRRQVVLLRSPMTKATICRVRRHIAVHSHRFCSFFCTQLQISSNARTSSGVAGEMRLFDIGQVLDMSFEPPCNSLPRHGKDPCHSTQAPPLQTSPQHGVLLAFRRRWLWFENAIGATVLAMVLSLSATIGSVFDDVRALTDTAGVRHCFLNHDSNSISSLTA